jgi:signal transduction histidine kinase
MASLGRLTAGIAHEIKNPLNFVNNFAKLSMGLLADLEAELAVSSGGNPDPERLEILSDLRFNAEKIQEHGKRADSIVKSMMRHARGKKGDRQPTDLNTLLDESLNLAYHGMRAQIPAFNTTLERDFDDAVGTIEVVPQELSRVFLNVLGNAFYAVLERKEKEADTYTPTVWVRTRRTGDGIAVSIRDNGPGIPEPLLAKIFEPFFTTKPTGSGTGLGLSLSYDVVVQGHGGTMKVESVEGEGATLIITLPAGGES